MLATRLDNVIRVAVTKTVRQNYFLCANGQEAIDHEPYLIPEDLIAVLRQTRFPLILFEHTEGATTEYSIVYRGAQCLPYFEQIWQRVLDNLKAPLPDGILISGKVT